MLAAIGNARGWRIRCHTPPNAKSHLYQSIGVVRRLAPMIAFDEKT